MNFSQILVKIYKLKVKFNIIRASLSNLNKSKVYYSKYKQKAIIKHFSKKKESKSYVVVVNGPYHMIS